MDMKDMKDMKGTQMDQMKNGTKSMESKPEEAMDKNMDMKSMPKK